MLAAKKSTGLQDQMILDKVLESIRPEYSVKQTNSYFLKLLL